MKPLAEAQKCVGSFYRLLKSLPDTHPNPAYECWLAEDPKGLRAVVRILSAWFCHHHSTRSTLIADFLAAVAAHRKIRHPSISPVLSSGSLGDRHWVARAYVPGPNLSQAGPFSVGDTIQLMDQVAKAVGVVHAQGLLHCNLKPENIFLSDGQVVVTDFGFPKFSNPDGWWAGAMVSVEMPVSAPDDLPNSSSDVYLLAAVARKILPPEQAESWGELKPLLERMSEPQARYRLQSMAQVRQALSQIGAAKLPRRQAMEKQTDWVFSLLAAAQALQADSLHVQVSASATVFHYVCPPLPQQSLSQWFSDDSRADQPGLRHLASGLLGALQQPGIGLTLTTGTSVATFVQGALKESANSKPVAGISIVLKSSGMLSHPSIEEIRQHFGYSQAPLYWNGQKIHRPLPQGRLQSEEQIGRNTVSLALLCEVPTLEFVVDGRSLPEDPARLGFPWAAAVVRGPLKLDASGQHVVLDDDFHSLMKRVRGRLEGLCRQINWSQTSQDVRALDLGAHLVGRLKRRSETQLVESIYAEVLGGLQRMNPNSDILHRLLDWALECQPLACHPILLRPVWAQCWCQNNWARAETLAQKLLGHDEREYRRFLLRIWALWRVAEPPGFTPVNLAEYARLIPQEGDFQGQELTTVDENLRYHLQGRLPQNASARDLEGLKQCLPRVPAQYSGLLRILRYRIGELETKLAGNPQA